ncbi:hypothetical protein [Amycolatopsis sp. VC5-11]|uniref:hypothetical protein n=1 Tax=Amycolatopsis sp. VC5-11 TaxID=3120156 RepID=UPI00055F6125
MKYIPARPRNPEAKLLDIRANWPVVQITHTFRVADRFDTEDGLTVETADMLFSADRYELLYAMEIR